MDTLPFDILTSIFSHLSQSDSLTCMQVCRAWYERVPQYTIGVWREIRFSYRTNLKDTRMLRCLGPHVHRAIFDELLGINLVEAMRILVDQGCTGIQNLEFNACTIIDESMFLDTLSQLSHSSLSCLTFRDHRSSTDLVGVLASCPHLVQLSYATDYLRDSKPKEPWRKDVQSHITHLHLHAPDLQHNHCLETVLQSCPDLAYLSLCEDLRTSPHGAVDLDHLWRLCPRLVSFESNIHCGGFHGWQHHHHQKKKQRRRGCPDDDAFVPRGLTHFSSVEQKGYGPDQMIPALVRNQHTLEVLSLRRNEKVCGIQGDWSPLRHGIIDLRHLRALTMDDISMDGPTIAALLARAPALEELMLVESSRRITDEVADALLGLRRLRCLHVCCTDEKRQVQGHRGFARFFERAKPSNLKVLGLMGRGLVTDTMLSHIATIPTLEKLGLWYVAGDDLSDSGMAAFASTLQTTSLEMIQLSDIHQITDRVLCELVRHQPRLKHMDLAGCNGLTDQGLLRALRSSGDTITVKSVSVQDCAMITDRAIIELVKTLGTDAVAYRKNGW